jgi:hypothetical protein
MKTEQTNPTATNLDFVAGLNLNTSQTRYNQLHTMRRGDDRYLCGRKANPIELRSSDQTTCVRVEDLPELSIYDL